MKDASGRLPTSSRHSSALMALLPPDTRFTITEIRQRWMLSHPNDQRTPASLSRWLRHHCERLVDEGRMQRNQISPRKTYFQLTPKPIAEQPIEPTSVWSELSSELDLCRRALLSQMSELEEYRRLKQAYPSIRDLVTERVNQLLENKYKLLGRTRALEAVMTAHDSAA